MEKLSLKERIKIYKQITEARKEFFKKLRQHDLGEVQIQDIQLKALEPVTGKLEEVKKQAQEIYVELQEYFRLNRMDEEIVEMKKIYEEIKNANEKLAFVKQVLEDIVNKQDVDFDEAKQEAKEDVETRERRDMEKEDIAGREDRERRSMEKEDIAGREDRERRSMEKEDIDVGVDDFLSLDEEEYKFKTFSIPVGNKGWVKLNKESLRNRNTGKLYGVTQLKRLLGNRYPSLKVQRLQAKLMKIYSKNNPDDIRNLLVENKTPEDMVEFARSIPPTPQKTKTVTDTGEEGVAISGKGIKRKRGRPRKKQEGGYFSLLTPEEASRVPVNPRVRDAIIRANKIQSGKGMKKRGRPKKEDKHLVNSLVLHTGSKAAGNDNLDNDIKQIINRMHKNKMITPAQKKELLEKYI